MRLRADLKREHERKMLEMQEASRRMKDDCDHRVQLEKYVTSCDSRQGDSVLVAHTAHLQLKYHSRCRSMILRTDRAHLGKLPKEPVLFSDKYNQADV